MSSGGLSPLDAAHNDRMAARTAVTAARHRRAGRREIRRLERNLALAAIRHEDELERHGRS